MQHTAVQRRNAIVQLLDERNDIRIQTLCEKFNVSEVTIRRDLEILESESRVRRIRGGAVLETSPLLETVFKDKMLNNESAKRAIAARAAELVENGQVVMLSAGSTTTLLARELKKKTELTVITTAVNIASELAGLEHITLIVTGGIVRPGSYAMVGHIPETELSSLNADMAFVGVDGVDLTAGFTTPNLMEAYTDKAMLQRAAKKVVVADSSKMRRRALSPITSISETDILVTDASADQDYIRQLKQQGIEVVIA